MTATHASSLPVPPGPVTSTGATGAARRLLRADALLCLVTGLVLVAGAAALTDLAGVETRWPTVAAGVFLLGLAGALALLARAEDRALRAVLPWSGEGDLAWAAGSVAVVALVDLTGPGLALVLAQAAVVAGIGVAKLALSRRLRAQSRS